MTHQIGLNREPNAYNRFFNILNSARVKICEMFTNSFLGSPNTFRWAIFPPAKCWAIASPLRQ